MDIALHQLLFKRFQLLDKDVISTQVSSGVGLNEAAKRSIIIRWPRMKMERLRQKVF